MGCCWGGGRLLLVCRVGGIIECFMLRWGSLLVRAIGGVFGDLLLGWDSLLNHEVASIVTAVGTFPFFPSELWRCVGCHPRQEPQLSCLRIRLQPETQVEELGEAKARKGAITDWRG